MSHEQLSTIEVVDREFERIKTWQANAATERKPGDKDEYFLSNLKPDIIDILLPRLLVVSVPLSHKYFMENAVKEVSQPSWTSIETFNTIYPNVTYEIIYKRDRKGDLYPTERRLIYTARNKSKHS